MSEPMPARRLAGHSVALEGKAEANFRRALEHTIELFRGALAAANSVSVKSLDERLEGAGIAEALHQARLEKIRAYRASLD